MEGVFWENRISMSMIGRNVTKTKKRAMVRVWGIERAQCAHHIQFYFCEHVENRTQRNINTVNKKSRRKKKSSRFTQTYNAKIDVESM